MAKRSYGSRYDEKLSTKEIAAKIRQNIKAHVATGALPQGLKVSVRYERFSGGTSIDTRVTAWPEGFLWLNPQWVLSTKESSNQSTSHQLNRYTEQARKVIETLKAIHDAYNHDDSDAMVDHFDVKYYGNVDVDWELEKPEMERVYKLLKTSVSQGHLADVAIGDVVVFTGGPLEGQQFVVKGIGRNEFLSLKLKALSGDEEIYADGLDLDNIKFVRRMPQGMRVVRFK